MNSCVLSKEFSENYSYKDLFLALRVCSTSSWEEAISQPSFMERVRYTTLKYDLTKQFVALKEFLDYIKECSVQPKIATKKQKDGEISVQNKESVPPTLSIVVFLMSKMGFTEEQAWNTPYSRIAWYMAGYAALESGDVEIISTEEEERAEQDKALIEKIAKEEHEKLNKAKKHGTR